MTPIDDSPVADTTRRVPWVWVALFAAMFIALLASIFWHLTTDYLPASALDLSASRYAQIDDKTAVLSLVVKNVPDQGEVHHQVRPAFGDDKALTVLIEPSSSQDDTRKHKGTVKLRIKLPVRDFVRVLDYRWHRGSGNPEGTEIQLERLP